MLDYFVIDNHYMVAILLNYPSGLVRLKFCENNFVFLCVDYIRKDFIAVSDSLDISKITARVLLSFLFDLTEKVQC